MEYKNITPPNLLMVRKAAEWWGDFILKPSHDNGDVMQSGFANALESLTDDVTKEDRDQFVENLIKNICDDWDKMYYIFDNRYPIIIDYSINGALKKSIKGLNINELKFPFKTNMYIYNDRVEVALGYGRKLKKI